MVSEKESSEHLRRIWSHIIGGRLSSELAVFLKENSNLPGPRGNLTLALEASRLIAGSWAEDRVFLRGCLDALLNSEDEYLSMTAYVSLGYIARDHPEEDGWALGRLYDANFDGRWRVREAVTFALQAALEKRAKRILDLLSTWCASGDAVLLRNALVSLCEPRLIESNPSILAAAKDYARRSMNKIRDAGPAKGAGLKILAKSLGFVLSVIAAADEGYLDKIEGWAREDVGEWRTILRSNVKKNRLRSKHEVRARNILTLLDPHKA